MIIIDDLINLDCDEISRQKYKFFQLYSTDPIKAELTEQFRLYQATLRKYSLIDGSLCFKYTGKTAFDKYNLNRIRFTFQNDFGNVVGV